MDPEARAKVAALVASSVWHPDDMEEIMSRLAPPPGAKASRHPMQKFTPNILHYFTAAEWQSMKGVRIGAAMDLLTSRLLQLGGRCLSEPCKAWCVSLCLLLNGMPHCTDATRAQVLQHFKKEYARRSRKAAKVDTVVVELPLPIGLKTQQPELYRSVFGDQEFVP